MNKIIFILFSVAGFLALGPSTAMGQRDYLTAEEVEIIRDAQQIDQRIEMLVHMIDRRFEVLKLDVAARKSSSKEKKDVWGELPTGTRRELLYDIKRILQKAIDDIDNLAERPTSMVIGPSDNKRKKPAGYAELFPKAVRSLADAAKRYAPLLKAELDKNNDPPEKGSILDSLDSCEQIIAALSKLSANGTPK